MTIKILKQGRLPEEVTYKFTCGHCRTEFTAQAKDGKVQSDQRDGSWLVVACPLCHNKCTSWNEYKEPAIERPLPIRPGWQDHVVEKYPNDRWPSFSEDPTY